MMMMMIIIVKNDVDGGSGNDKDHDGGDNGHNKAC